MKRTNASRDLQILRLGGPLCIVEVENEDTYGDIANKIEDVQPGVPATLIRFVDPDGAPMFHEIFPDDLVTTTIIVRGFPFAGKFNTHNTKIDDREDNDKIGDELLQKPVAEEWQDNQFALYAVEAIWWPYGAPKYLMNFPIWDRKRLVVQLIQRYGWRNKENLLKMVSERLRDDRDVVLAAVKQNGVALEHASERLKQDHEVCLEAVRSNGKSLEFACDDMKSSRKIVTVAVKENWRALEFASDKLRSDRHVVLEAIRQSGKALIFASSQLQRDKDIVLMAGRHRCEFCE